MGRPGSVELRQGCGNRDGRRSVQGAPKGHWGLSPGLQRDRTPLAMPALSWPQPSARPCTPGPAVTISRRGTSVWRSFPHGPGRLPSLPALGRCDVGPPSLISSPLLHLWRVWTSKARLVSASVWLLLHVKVPGAPGAQQNKDSAVCGRRLSPGAPTSVKTRIGKSRSFLGNYVSGIF